VEEVKPSTPLQATIALLQTRFQIREIKILFIILYSPLQALICRCQNLISCRYEDLKLLQVGTYKKTSSRLVLSLGFFFDKDGR